MRVSVIIPAHNAQAHLPVLLGSIVQPPGYDLEVIVVDDASQDRTAAVAEEAGCHVVRLRHNRGPAAARNAGARHATGAVLVFTDADIELRPDTLIRILEAFEAHPECAAVVGNLCPDPPAGSWLSRYKNLYTHYSYRHCGPWIGVTFTSLTAVRAEAFWRVGGMPEIHPNEDRAFGMALSQGGLAIRFEPELQVRHHHAYRPTELARMEFERGRNITLLTLEAWHRRTGPTGEHVPVEFRVAVLWVGGAWASALLVPWVGPLSPLLAAGCLAGAGLSLRPFLSFLRERGGVGFALFGLPTALADLSLVGLGGVVAVAEYALGGRRVLSGQPRVVHPPRIA